MLQPLIACVGEIALKRHSFEVASGHVLVQERILMCLGVRLRRSVALDALGERLAWCCSERSLGEASSVATTASHSSLLHAEPLMPSL